MFMCTYYYAQPHPHTEIERDAKQLKIISIIIHNAIEYEGMANGEASAHHEWRAAENNQRKPLAKTMTGVYVLRFNILPANQLETLKTMAQRNEIESVDATALEVQFHFRFYLLSIMTRCSENNGWIRNMSLCRHVQSYYCARHDPTEMN